LSNASSSLSTVENFDNKSNWCCCSNRSYITPYECGPRKLNPVWTGNDNSQIGIFIRNLKFQGVDEDKMTVQIHFYLNVVWKDAAICAYAKKEDEKSSKCAGKKNQFEENKRDPENKEEPWWQKQMTENEYTALWTKVHDSGSSKSACKYHLNKWPELRIWHLASERVDEQQTVFSLNKKWIGKDTVYWRRLIRAKVFHNFKNRTYPFGYEMIKLKVRLTSYTAQHLVLFRSNLWFKEHKKQTSVQLAGHSFSYLHPDKSLLIDWTPCSVHDGKDGWYSKFDHNDLSYRLPVYVSPGMDTQSWFEGLLILKRHPRFVIWNIWIWFTLSCVLSLFTYSLDPQEDIADRLAIAVGIIFVQMQLKINSSSKTPRMPYTTTLDIHMMLSVLLVVIQAALQVISKYVRRDDGVPFDTILAYVNLGVVIAVNFGMIRFAKFYQNRQRKRIGSKVSLISSFDENELNIGAPECVKIKGYRPWHALRISNAELQDWRGSLLRRDTDRGCCFKYCKGYIIVTEYLFG